MNEKVIEELEKIIDDLDPEQIKYIAYQASEELCLEILDRYSEKLSARDRYDLTYIMSEDKVKELENRQEERTQKIDQIVDDILSKDGNEQLKRLVENIDKLDAQHIKYIAYEGSEAIRLEILDRYSEKLSERDSYDLKYSMSKDKVEELENRQEERTQKIDQIVDDILSKDENEQLDALAENIDKLDVKQIKYIAYQVSEEVRLEILDKCGKKLEGKDFFDLMLSMSEYSIEELENKQEERKQITEEAIENIINMSQEKSNALVFFEKAEGEVPAIEQEKAMMNISKEMEKSKDNDKSDITH